MINQQMDDYGSNEGWAVTLGDREQMWYIKTMMR
jgi:hypothetical protein